MKNKENNQASATDFKQVSQTEQNEHEIGRSKTNKIQYEDQFMKKNQVFLKIKAKKTFILAVVVILAIIFSFILGIIFQRLAHNNGKLQQDIIQKPDNIKKQTQIKENQNQMQGITRQKIAKKQQKQIKELNYQLQKQKNYQRQKQLNERKITQIYTIKSQEKGMDIQPDKTNIQIQKQHDKKIIQAEDLNSQQYNNQSKLQGIKLKQEEQDQQEKREKEAADLQKKQQEKHKLLDDVTDLSQLYNLSEATIFKPTEAMRKDHQQTMWQQNGKQPVSGEVSVVMTTSGRSEYLNKSIASLFEFNTYPIKEFIVVQDGPNYQALGQLMTLYKNITWIVTNKNIGQIAAMDVGYSQITTEYYFHTEDDWVFIRPGFIEFCLVVYAAQPNVSQVILYKKQLNLEKGEKWKKQTFKQSFYSGYTFNPSLHRLADYQIWPGGFSNMTFFSSYGKGAGTTQIIISMLYIMNGKHTIDSPYQFVRHIGSASSGNKYWNADFKKSKSAKKIDQTWARFDQWILKIKKQETREQDQKRAKQQEALLKIQQEKHKLLDNITDLSQLYNFSEATVVEPTEALKMNKKQKKWKENGKQPVSGEVTVVMTTTGTSEYLNKSIASFFQFNTYPIEGFIVVQDGPNYEALGQLMALYKNITWIVTNKSIGQIAAMDVGYSYVNTEYYFHTQDDWVFIRSGFIEFCLVVYAAEPNVSQVILYKKQLNLEKGEKWKKQTFKQSYYSGFDFSPSLHRLADYQIWPGGFSNLTFFTSFYKGAGSAGVLICMNYQMLGKYTIQSPYTFIEPSGFNKYKDKYWSQLYKQSKSSQKAQKFWYSYDLWAAEQMKKN